MAEIETPRSNTKQFGDACEHYVVAMLGFANVPAVKMPDADSDEGGHLFQSDPGHHSNLMAAR
jgi:hypothetical protein